MAAVRISLLVLLIYALPTPAVAGCGPFSPCGTPGWFGFSLALPIPRLPHLHTFATCGGPSPLCGNNYPGSAPRSCGLFGNPCGYGCGGGCGVPAPMCAPQPAPCQTCPSFAPPLMSPPPTLQAPSYLPTSCNPCEQNFAQTQLIPQQTVSYRDVPQIQYRQEPYTTSVPVTTYQQVTQYRNVPYQTTARIPQISTQYIPQMTAAAPCNTCTSGISSPYIGSNASTYGLPYAPTPSYTSQTAGIPEYPYPTTQPYTSATNDWQTIPQREAAAPTEVQQMGYYPSYGTQPQRQAAPTGLFRPAPSAAAAWQSPFLR